MDLKKQVRTPYNSGNTPVQFVVILKVIDAAFVNVKCSEKVGL